MQKPIVIAMIFLISLSAHAETFKKIKILVDDKSLTVELAESPEQRSQGLMHRKSLGDDEGMLFVFENERVLSFWMKNTFIPLSIGFFDKNKKLKAIKDMAPTKSVLETNLPSYSSEVPVKYALEVNEGWFKKNKIKVGSKLKINEN